MQLVNQHKQLGFSMVELGVVMSVIAIVSLIAVPSFRSMMGNAQIRSTAESFRNGLQLARTESIKRNQLISFRLNANYSWQVGCVTVSADCPATIAEKAAKEGSSANITVTRVGGDTAQFTAFGTMSAVPDQLSQIDISNPSMSAAEVRRLRIMLGAGGNVRMCEPDIATLGDPRRCL